MDYTGNLPVEILQTILEHMPQEHVGAFLQTSQHSHNHRGYNLYRHIDISYQDPQQIFQLCALSFSKDYISKYARTLTINTFRLRLPSESTPPLLDEELILQWIAKLFPYPPMDKRRRDILVQCEKNRKLWHCGFLKSVINAMLASILVNGTNLQQVSLQTAALGSQPTFAELVCSKVAYDYAMDVETFPKIRRFSFTPSYMDNGVPLLPNLHHFALHYATAGVGLCIHPLKCTELGTLRSLTFRHVYAAGDKVRGLLALTNFPFLKELCIFEGSWDDDLSYPDLVSLIHNRCPSLQTLVLDFMDNADEDPSNKPKPLFYLLASVTSARIHVRHLPDSYQDLAYILASGHPAWPESVQRLEITGLAVPMLNAMAAAYVMSQPVGIKLASVQELRLTFESNALFDQDLRDFDSVLVDVIDACRRKGVYIGVYQRRTGDLDAVDEFHMGHETKAILGQADE
ncbi:hypothetical protein COCHEDRAFT_1218153 [Bipolaris maydis C5]|uniref:F-box domain-containing protein n=2 Tax=Cochliobolus heterostrophus TaxID=5016 RepID=M2TXW6_COCH5|nr:hypothetical protein COCHEDRAFT_1218153 [Bipolaris maydis C5]KAJ6203832.1 hypothetical protein PSV09DRAFT_1218153 [Bipolaris maydis]KAJ6267515.1 hypothetical protein PSV08DRAFT_250655 [Bipolaris maydis]KAJ6267544.1 hypothetical protein PSV08DRAFT_250677 [Bipolaris maydis]